MSFIQDLQACKRIAITIIQATLPNLGHRCECVYIKLNGKTSQLDTNFMAKLKYINEKILSCLLSADKCAAKKSFEKLEYGTSPNNCPYYSFLVVDHTS